MSDREKSPDTLPETAPETAPETPTEQPPKLTFWQLLKTSLAALIGVQTEANRSRDFQSGRPLQFILLGVVAALIFVLLVVAVVQLVLSQAG